MGFDSLYSTQIGHEESVEHHTGRKNRWTSIPDSEKAHIAHPYVRIVSIPSSEAPVRSSRRCAASLTGQFIQERATEGQFRARDVPAEERQNELPTGAGRPQPGARSSLILRAWGSATYAGCVLPASWWVSVGKCPERFPVPRPVRVVITCALVSRTQGFAKLTIMANVTRILSEVEQGNSGDVAHH